MRIPFTRPYYTGNEEAYIHEAMHTYGKISGNGHYTGLCQHFFEERYGISKALLTTSCTDALEMAAMLAGIGPGDEVIVPSYTFVSTALAFVRQGATVVFADSCRNVPNIDPSGLEALITDRTRAIVPVHYAGIACDMDAILAIAAKHDLLVIEDAAQAIDSFNNGKPLGTQGHLSAFSFHETKNITSGEGGLLGINDPRFIERAEIIWEKGTNRSVFLRGEVDKYGWVDLGSSFLPSEIIAAMLWAQLEALDAIQSLRKCVWERYAAGFRDLHQEGLVTVQPLPAGATNNAHMFYGICRSLVERTGLIDYLRKQGVHAVFHYLSLHRSSFYRDRHIGGELPMSDWYTDCLVRFPLYAGMSFADVDTVVHHVQDFFKGMDH